MTLDILPGALAASRLALRGFRRSPGPHMLTLLNDCTMLPHLITWRSLVVAAAAAILVFPETACQAGQRESLLAAWQKRQAAAKTLEASWQTSRSMSRNYAQQISEPKNAPAVP